MKKKTAHTGVHLFIQDPILCQGVRAERETYRCSKGWCLAEISARKLINEGRLALWTEEGDQE